MERIIMNLSFAVADSAKESHLYAARKSAVGLHRRAARRQSLSPC
ncbi:MAG: hypothetical protein ACFN4Y_08205 [Centipeda sp. (in: firmicutes)]